jgi:hypothetical protein
VLAPTITIRNQWADRLVDHFLPAGEPRPSWLSADLKNPALLTIATYQALHSLCSGELEKESRKQLGSVRVLSRHPPAATNL